jgi:TolB protein
MSYARRYSALLLLLLMAAPAAAEDKVYIDVVSAPRRIPVAVQALAGQDGDEVARVVASDLEFSGLFDPLNREAFLERPEAPFQATNWVGLGAEAVVKGSLTSDGKEVNATVHLYDAFEGRLLLKKNYRTRRELLRPLGHSIANDIFKELTGQDGVFRTKIAFVRKDGSSQELYLMDWDGGRPVQLGVRGAILIAPRWSSDGSRLLFTAERNRSWNVHVVDFRKRRQERVFSGPGTIIGGDFLPGDDSFLLSSSHRGSPDLYRYRTVSGSLERLTADRGIEVSPTPSPDGSAIAFVSNRSGTPQIYTMDKNGYNRSRVTFEGSYNTSPAWSPRGDMLAFSGARRGRNQIFVVRPDGSGLRQLTSDGNNEEPTFSPDGRFIAFASDRDGRMGIYVMRTDGEGQRRVSPDAMTVSDPRWSPR